MITKKLNYVELFEKVEGLQKVLLVTTGRTGSDLFQNMLDGHPEILQIVGHLHFHEFWNNAICKDDINDLINEFIWSSYPLPFISRFKSRYGRQERWDELGENRDQTFSFDTELFKVYFYHLMQFKDVTERNVFFAIHIAYGLVTNIDIQATKILFYHIHNFERLADFSSISSNYDIVCTVRDPRNTITAGLLHHRDYNPASYDSGHVSSIYRRNFEESEPLSQYTISNYTLKLEDLCVSTELVMEQFCNKYNLKYLPEILFLPTLHGKKWWGDALSKQYYNGLNKNIGKPKWKKSIPFYENYVLEYILINRLKKYNYAHTKTFKSLFFLPIVLILILIPIKSERSVFIFRLLNDVGLKSKFKNILSFMFNYLLRVCLQIRYLSKRARGQIFVSKHFYNLDIKK